MKKTYVAGIVVIIIICIFLFFPRSNTGYVSLESHQGEVKLYKSLTCGCCELHSQYLEYKGKLDVRRVNLQDLSDIKQQYGVPNGLQSCHTAVVGDYFVEGHMPLEAIEKLMGEKPDIAGIAMPGMPSGSPGMPGTKYSDFVIYAVEKDGSYYEFMRI